MEPKKFYGAEKKIDPSYGFQALKKAKAKSAT